MPDGTLQANQLFQAGRQINAATNMRAVFQCLVDYAAESGVVDLAFLLAPDPHALDYLKISNLWNHESHGLGSGKNHFLRGQHPSIQLIEAHIPVLIADGSNDSRLDPQMQAVFNRLQAGPCAFLPLGTEMQWMGALVLGRTKDKLFDQPTLQPFLNLCGQASVALNNLLLLRETNALYSISQTLSQTLTSEDAFLSILEQVARFTGIAHCRITLFDEQTRTGRERYHFDLASNSGNAVTNNEGPVFPMGSGTLYALLQNKGTPVLCMAGNKHCPADAAAFLADQQLNALYCIPIMGQQDVLGFLALDSNSGDRPFTVSNKNFAQNAVAQLTTFLENISLFAEANTRAQELIQINQVVSRLAGILDLDRLLDVLIEEVNRLLTVDIFFLVRFRPVVDGYDVLRYVIDGQSQITTRTKRHAPSLPDILKRGGVLTGLSAQSLAAEFQTYTSRTPQSYLWVTYQEEQQPAGLIGVHAYQAQAYSENDQHLFRSIANQAGMAITNARLFQRTQDNVAEFRLLFTIAQAAAARVNATERLNSMVQALHQGLRGHTIVVYGIHSGGNRLELLAHAGDLVPHPLLTLTGGLSGQVARLTQPLLVNNLLELTEYDTEIEGAAAQLSAPLLTGQNLVGVVTVAAGETDSFSERDLRLVETSSVGLAATLESTRLFDNIQATNERLRALDQLKNRFLANMAHELRTPLNAIIGFSRVILKGIDGPITSKQEEDLTAIYENGQHLLLLINDVLDLAKIEAGKIALVIETIDLAELLTNIVSTIRGVLHDKPVSLQVEVESGIPRIEGDKIRLRQILLNLLSNAAKYTAEGQISCRIAHVDGEHVQIVIHDTGVGIAPTDFGRLFRAFEQADSTSRSAQGTGLGLPISKSLVEMHHGRIWFESVLNQGSTFYVLLPVRQPEAGTTI